MRRKYLLLTAGLAFGVALTGQTPPGAFQFFTVNGGLAPGQASMPMPQPEPGRPFSATATTETRQTLSDGTNVSQTTAILEYRDAEGRVRTENGRAAAGAAPQTNTITIRDPVAGVGYTLNPVARTAFRNGVVFNAGGRGGSGSFGGRGGSGGVLTVFGLMGSAEGSFGGRGGSGGRGGRGGRGGSGGQFLSQALQMDLPVVTTPFYQTLRNNIVDDLGVMTINGVQARGTRTTTIVPVGAIGNDREFRSVSERWFSSDLNLLIKSVNTDPRFGTTTYELMNISRTPPDPYLFQVPAGLQRGQPIASSAPLKQGTIRIGLCRYAPPAKWSAVRWFRRSGSFCFGSA